MQGNKSWEENGMKGFACPSPLHGCKTTGLGVVTDVRYHVFMDYSFSSSIAFNTFRHATITPQELLGHFYSVTTYTAFGFHELCQTWLSHIEYLDWAQRSLDYESPFGPTTSLVFSKRAVCRAIDCALANLHFRCLRNTNYPERLRCLEELGFTTPSIIHQLIIEPRNETEHKYTPCSVKNATNALELARLFLKDFARDIPQSAPVMMAHDITSRSNGGANTHVMTISRLGNTGLFFIDCLRPNPTINYVEPAIERIRSCEIGSFTLPQSMDFAKKLRSVHPISAYPLEGYREMLRQLFGGTVDR